MKPTVLTPAGDSLRPDLLIPTSERLYGVWYGIQSGVVTLRIESQFIYMSRQEIVVRENRAESFYADLHKLPKPQLRRDVYVNLEIRARRTENYS